MDFNCVVAASLDGISLLHFLKIHLVNYSNRKIKIILEMGCTTINGVVERFSSKKVFKDDVICYLEKKTHVSTKVSILFEDEHFFAINKPINFESSQDNINKNFLNGYLVHRLDKNTTGVLLIAKTKRFKRNLEDLFREKKITKKYIALIDGLLKKPFGTIKSYLMRGKSYQGQNLWMSSHEKKGLLACTNFKKVKSFNDFSIVDLSPITGRTHQLRVHMKELGHPILGDFQYCRNFKSSKNVSSLCLHSCSISFIHPITLSLVFIEAPLPDIISSLYNPNG
jgi:RluA family pseudouridine synthase